MNRSGSPLARSRSKRADAKLRGGGVLSSACLRSERSGTRVGETRRKRRQGHPLCPSDQQGRLVPRRNPRHPSGRSGVLMVQHLGRAEPVRRLPVQILPARSGPPELPGGELSPIMSSRTGPGISGSATTNLSIGSIPPPKPRPASPIDRNGPHSVLGPVWHINQDRAGILWLATATGLHRLDPASGAFRHYSHDPADPASLSSSVVRSTYEDREGTLWVCTLAGSGRFRPAHGKSDGADPPERARCARSQGARGPLGRAVDHLHVRQWAGLLGSPYTAAHAVFVQGPRAAGLSSSAGWRESTKTPMAICGWRRTVAVWSGSIRAGGARSDTATRRSIRTASMTTCSMSVFEDREGSIWVGSGDGRTEPFSEKTAAVPALPT